MKHPDYKATFQHLSASGYIPVGVGWGVLGLHMPHMIHTRVVCFHYLKLNRLIYIYETHLFLENLPQEDFNNPTG